MPGATTNSLWRDHGGVAESIPGSSGFFDQLDPTGPQLDLVPSHASGTKLNNHGQLIP
jgi:hypothetical protein